MFASLVQDVRYAARALRRQPGFTIVAMLTLALGIGANTAVYSVVDGVLLSALPYREPERLAGVWPGHFASHGELVYLQQHARSFEGGAAAFSPGWGITMNRAGEAVPLAGARTSANFFRVLGAQPALGRTFADDESTPGHDAVTILSHELYESRFASDPRVIGTTISLDGGPVTIIGVMPPAFRLFQANAQLWLPLELDPSAPWYKKGGTSFLVGRLRAGATRNAALAELRSLVPEMRRELGFEDTYGRDIGIVSLRDAVVGSLRTPLLVLLGAVGCIVLIAGANVGNLLLARAAGRRGEITVRVALGASRGRVIRQMLSESVVLSACGGVLGMALGAAGVSALKRMLPATTPRLEAVRLDATVFAVCALVTLAVGILCGLAPALVASRPDLQSALRGARGDAGGAGGRRARGALVTAEVALALVLVIGAGLMMQTLWRLSRVDPGFRTANVLTMRVQPTSNAFSTSELRARYFLAVIDRLRRERGVVAVGEIHHLPLSGFNWHRETGIDGTNPAPGEAPFRPGFRTIAGDYLGVMRIPLLAGRAFDAHDVRGAPPVAIVSEAFARKAFGATDVVGRRIRPGNTDNDPWVTIVGVAGSVRHAGLTMDPEPEFYLHTAQFPQGSTAIVVRTAGDPETASRQLHDAVASVERSVPISELRTADELVGSSVEQPRVIMALLLAFAAVGLALGAIGIYGVVSYAVSGRVREIGIRIALGARRGVVVRAVLREGMGFTLAGVALGLGAASLLTRALGTLVYGVSTTDPLTFVALAILLVAVALVASWIPARRAARVDPMVALRGE
ncbi:MAG: ABC transporter permease [Gemmatimonadaceae bacterium]